MEIIKCSLQNNFLFRNLFGSSFFWRSVLFIASFAVGLFRVIQFLRKGEEGKKILLENIPIVSCDLHGEKKSLLERIPRPMMWTTQKLISPQIKIDPYFPFSSVLPYIPSNPPSLAPLSEETSPRFSNTNLRHYFTESSQLTREDSCEVSPDTANEGSPSPLSPFSRSPRSLSQSLSPEPLSLFREASSLSGDVLDSQDTICPLPFSPNKLVPVGQIASDYNLIEHQEKIRALCEKRYGSNVVRVPLKRVPGFLSRLERFFMEIRPLSQSPTPTPPTSEGGDFRSGTASPRSPRASSNPISEGGNFRSGTASPRSPRASSNSPGATR